MPDRPPDRPGERTPDRYLKPYREAVERYGAGFHATLWTNPESQRLRFNVMIDMAALHGCSIVDAGCGQGDFAEHLIERQVAFKRYIGIDAVPEMIEAARKRCLPRCEFHFGDVIHDQTPLREIDPDFVCISGTLNTMDEETARKLVEAAFEASMVGVIFNFLSDRVGEKWGSHNIGPAQRFNTLSWIDWALTKTPRVSFTQDYMDGHDATILMRKE